MAIDKDIPNEQDRAKIEIEANEQEVEVQQDEPQKGPVEINELEDGGVEVDLVHPFGLHRS